MIKKFLAVLLIVGIMVGSFVMVVSIQNGTLLSNSNGIQTEQPGEEPGDNEEEQPNDNGDKNNTIVLSQDYIYF